MLISCSYDWRFPLRFNDVALVQRSPRLELCLQFHEQHHVWRIVRNLARAVPDKGSRDRKRTGCGREPCVWDHVADYRSLLEPPDFFADLYCGFSVYRGGFPGNVVAIRAAREGVVVDTRTLSAYNRMLLRTVTAALIRGRVDCAYWSRDQTRL